MDTKTGELAFDFDNDRTCKFYWKISNAFICRQEKETVSLDALKEIHFGEGGGGRVKVKLCKLLRVIDVDKR